MFLDYCKFEKFIVVFLIYRQYKEIVFKEWTDFRMFIVHTLLLTHKQNKVCTKVL